MPTSQDHKTLNTGALGRPGRVGTLYTWMLQATLQSGGQPTETNAGKDLSQGIYVADNSCVVYTWALKDIPDQDFGVYEYTIMLRAFGLWA